MTSDDDATRARRCAIVKVATFRAACKESNFTVAMPEFSVKLRPMTTRTGCATGVSTARWLSMIDPAGFHRFGEPHSIVREIFPLLH
jgi:hypothetical protein